MVPVVQARHARVIVAVRLHLVQVIAVVRQVVLHVQVIAALAGRRQVLAIVALPVVLVHHVPAAVIVAAHLPPVLPVVRGRIVREVALQAVHLVVEAEVAAAEVAVAAEDK